MNERVDIILFVFFVAFAATIACASFPATRPAGIRRAAEAQLKACRKGTRFPYEFEPCYAQVRAFCRSQGLEKTCGEGAP